MTWNHKFNVKAQTEGSSAYKEFPVSLTLWLHLQETQKVLGKRLLETAFLHKCGVVDVNSSYADDPFTGVLL